MNETTQRTAELEAAVDCKDFLDRELTAEREANTELRQQLATSEAARQEAERRTREVEDYGRELERIAAERQETIQGRLATARAEGRRDGIDAAGMIIARLVDQLENSGSKGAAEAVYHYGLLEIRALAAESGKELGE